MQATSFGTVQGGIGGGEYGFGLFERERFRWSAWLAGGISRSMTTFRFTLSRA
jgi:hypothetical protein